MLCNQSKECSLNAKGINDTYSTILNKELKLVANSPPLRMISCVLEIYTFNISIKGQNFNKDRIMFGLLLFSYSISFIQITLVLSDPH